jgi:PII-like signaling protein
MNCGENPDRRGIIEPSDGIQGFETRDSAIGGRMLKAGPAKKVTIYVGEDRQYHGTSAYAAILDYLFYRGVAGANVMRGVAGFGADHHLHTTRILVLTENLPIRIEFIESPEKVEELMPKLHEMAGTGLIEIQDTTVAKAPETSVAHQQQETSPPLKREGKARLMRIYIGENDKWRDKPLHRALIESMRANDIAGVTVYQGILGYGANRRIHKDSALHLSHDRPVMLSVVDTEEKLRAFFPILDQMVQQGLVVLSNVDVIKYTHDYRFTERRKEARQ